MSTLEAVPEEFGAVRIPVSADMVKAQKRELVLTTASTLDPGIPTVMLESQYPVSQIPVHHRNGVVYEAPLLSDLHFVNSSASHQPVKIQETRFAHNIRTDVYDLTS